MQFCRDTFSQALTFYRKQQKLSQDYFAQELALNHPMFEAVSQSILSKWESAKQEPPLLKRMCIANILGQSYKLNSDEKNQLKHPQSLDLQHQKFQNIYDYQYNKVESTPWLKLDVVEKDIISKAHLNLTHEALSTTLGNFENLDLNIIKVSYNDVLLGHCLMGRNNKFEIVLSLVFTNIEVLKVLFNQLESFVKEKLIIPAFTQSADYFLKHMQYEQVNTQSVLPFYIMPVDDIKNNKLLRYFIEGQDDSTLKSFALKE